ncbi:MAG: hypothetical protein JOY79_07415 [Acidobacteriaceae bacterium]|nr:hypothetical protein [Acidobacteriaceae bacterium]
MALLIFLVTLTAAANSQGQPAVSVTTSPVHVTHILGFEDVHRNVNGELTIDDKNLQFQRDGSPSARVTVASIQNISLGEQDKQVGGVPLMLGKAAVPYGGGRVVSLFSHKKYDSLGIEYLDPDGGFHGVIFRLARGQAEIFKSSLIAHGVHIAPAEATAPVQAIPAASLQAQKWSVQVERVNPGDTTVDPCFLDAIYENLLRQLANSKQFQNVFRSGDRNANNVSELLLLKTVVEKYSAGSETRRAVTTVSGATKLKVNVQLVTRNGQVVLERAVEGNVRFLGENLKATHNIAKNTATILKGSTLPSPAAPQQPTSSEVKASAAL